MAFGPRYLPFLFIFLCLQEDRDAFFVADLGDVVRKHIRFLKALPRVKPFYAVKCNSSKGVVQTLAELGAGFDCASKVIMKIIYIKNFLHGFL